ncbi:hypothetical protein [Streptosporangium vulgare]
MTVGGAERTQDRVNLAPAQHMYFQVDDAVAFDGAFVACLQVE